MSDDSERLILCELTSLLNLIKSHFMIHKDGFHTLRFYGIYDYFFIYIK